jgi:hypothetical protein
MNNLEERKKAAARTRAWRAANPQRYKEHGNKWYAEHKQETVQKARERYLLYRAFLEWLKAVPCLDCGKEYPPYVLDFDHRPGVEKKFVIGHWSVKRYPLDVLQEEVMKCDLVCANCHRQRTHGERKVQQ